MVGALLDGVYTYALVFMRMAGMIAFNPLLAHRHVPAMLRAGLVFMLTLLVAPGVTVGPEIATSLDWAAAMLKEVTVGLFLGMVFHIFYYMLFTVGDIMDTQFGMAMAKVFDPGASIQMSMSSSLLNILFILYLLSTNSHLIMIRMFALSFDTVAVGSLALSDDLLGRVLSLYSGAFALALRLAIPFIAAEFVLEMSMGVLMKLIPQIHVFVINIQFKVLLGLLLLFLFASPVTAFLEHYLEFTLQNMRDMLSALA